MPRHDQSSRRGVGKRGKKKEKEKRKKEKEKQGNNYPNENNSRFLSIHHLFRSQSAQSLRLPMAASGTNNLPLPDAIDLAEGQLARPSGEKEKAEVGKSLYKLIARPILITAPTPREPSSHSTTRRRERRTASVMTYYPSGRYRLTTRGIFFSCNSFSAICSGSVSPPVSTSTGAFMLICSARVPRSRARSYLVM